jgi:curved DNA-binding protein CbpA
LLPSLYDVLGVAPDASPDELHSAYRARARELHPDVVGDSGEAMRELNTAWEILRDPDARAEYDAEFLVDLPPVVRAVRIAPVVALLIVLLLIFVSTAYFGSGGR